MRTLSARGRNKPNVYIHAAEISEANRFCKTFQETPPSVQESDYVFLCITHPYICNTLFTFLLFTERAERFAMGIMRASDEIF